VVTAANHLVLGVDDRRGHPAAVDDEGGAGMAQNDDSDTWGAVNAGRHYAQPAAPLQGYYEFDEDGFNDAINQVTACIEKVGEAYDKAQPMTGVLPMGNEPASRKAAAGINRSGVAYMAHNQDLENFYRTIRQDLITARDKYLAQEQHTKGAMNNLQEGL
jgi:PE family